MRPRTTTAVLSAVLVGGVGTLVALMARGKLTLDVGWGRSVHPLGPIVVRFAAPRELVFEQISSAYLGRTPRETRAHLEVVERGSDLVVATHYTRVWGYTAETTEAVGFEPPERIRFRHLRGPVPCAIEEFVLVEVDGGDATELTYRGELGIDFWVLGELAGRLVVVPFWEDTVRDSLEESREQAERRAAARARRAEHAGRS